MTDKRFMNDKHFIIIPLDDELAQFEQALTGLGIKEVDIIEAYIQAVDDVYALTEADRQDIGKIPLMPKGNFIDMPDVWQSNATKHVPILDLFHFFGDLEIRQIKDKKEMIQEFVFQYQKFYFLLLQRLILLGYFNPSEFNTQDVLVFDSKVVGGLKLWKIKNEIKPNIIAPQRALEYDRVKRDFIN